MGKVTVRPFKEKEWQLLRKMRLRALSLNPGYFTYTIEKTKTFLPSYWKNFISGNNRAFGLFNDDQCTGITAAITHADDPSGQTGLFALTFIEPEYRGKGYAQLFYDARLEFAKNHPEWTRLETVHRAGNEPSKHYILKNGFKWIEDIDFDWPDGTRDIKHKYELDLEKFKKRGLTPSN